MSEPDVKKKLSRRDALKRIASLGAAASVVAMTGLVHGGCYSDSYYYSTTYSSYTYTSTWYASGSYYSM